MNTPKNTKNDNNATAPLEADLSSKLEPIPKSYENSEVLTHAICESAKKLYWGKGVEIDYLGAQKNFLKQQISVALKPVVILGLSILVAKELIKIFKFPFNGLIRQRMVEMKLLKST